MERKRRHRSTIRSQVLTLRMTEEEMLRFRVAALALGKKRARIVRERVADLIGAPAVGTSAAAGRTDSDPNGGQAGETAG